MHLSLPLPWGLVLASGTPVKTCQMIYEPGDKQWQLACRPPENFDADV